MRVLFLCQFFAPDITAAAFRMSDFARLLAEAGDEVVVITSNPHKSDVSHVDDSPFRELGIRVERCDLAPVSGSGARTYVKHYLSFVRGAVRLGWKIWREGWKPDVIYCSSPPLFVGIAGRVLKLLFRRPLVFEVRDIWPDAAVSAGLLKEGGRAYKMGQLLERTCYSHAAHITCVAKPMQTYLCEHPAVKKKQVPVTVVYNGTSVDDSAPADNSDASTTDNPEVKREKQTLLYAGNLGLVQQLDLLIHGFAELTKDGALEGWNIELLGTGAQLERLKQLAQELSVADRVRFTAAVPRAEATRKMREADLLYLHLMGDKTMEKTIPSKVFDYLLAATPIVGGIAGEGREILESTAANVVFSPGSREELKQALVNAAGNWKTLEAAADKNRDLVLERFTRRQASIVLRNVFQSVATQK